MYDSPPAEHPLAEYLDRRPLVVLWTYDPDAASARHRLRPVLRALGHRWEVKVDRLPKGRYYRRVLERRRDLERASLLILGKTSLGLGEARLARAFSRRILFDVDDAIYLRRQRSAAEVPGQGAVRMLKFRQTCSAADRVVVGNETLAEATRRNASAVRVLPTSVMIPSWRALSSTDRRPRTLVWIGRPENLVYLEPLRPLLAELCRTMPDLVLRVVSSEFPDWPDVRLEKIPWSTATEVQSLSSAGIGIMPLSDDDWTRGKCGFKLLQYMSVGLPTIASPVGANQTIVDDRVTGYLAEDLNGWAAALRRLLDHPGHAAMLGEAGRVRAETHYGRIRYVSQYLGVIGDLLLDHQPVQPSRWPAVRTWAHAGRG
ncbi:MAG: glycosyltransferase family 4 protein [Acidobacteriota bacterium]